MPLQFHELWLERRVQDAKQLMKHLPNVVKAAAHATKKLLMKLAISDDVWEKQLKPLARTMTRCRGRPEGTRPAKTWRTSTTQGSRQTTPAGR